MINTFHTSYNPPPVPPRAGYSKPRPMGNTSLVKFLSVMLLLLMILTFGGFLYLFQRLNVLQDSYNLEILNECVENIMGKDSTEQCRQMVEKYKAALARASQENEKSYKLTGGSYFNEPAAHMTAMTEHKDKTSNFLKTSNLLWDEKHSLIHNVRLSTERDKLIIQSPGTYFIYSQVTFSKSPSYSLKQSIKSTTPKGTEPKELLKSFCSLNPSNLCTASQAGVFHLEKGQQLYVTVSNTSLVNRDSCNFGLFKLR